MRTATILVCLSVILAWIGTTEASPFENIFQKGKEAFKKMAGGDNNPFVAMGQKFLDEVGFDEYQKQWHDMASKAMEEGQEHMQEAMKKFAEEMQKMKDGGASKDQMKEKFAQFMKSMPQS